MKRLLLALALLPASAFATCPAANQFSFSFADRPAATLSYGGTYSYTATATGGATRAFTTSIAQNGMSSTQGNGVQLPAIGTLITGPDATRRTLVLGGSFAGRTANLNSGTRVVTVTFSFATPIRTFSTTLHDVDFSSNQYRDWIGITGANGAATYTAAMSAPPGNGNSGGARSATGSTVLFGAGDGLTVEQAAGTSTSGNNSDAGTVTASFAQPVTSVTLRYGNAPLSSGETSTGQQAIGIAGISFCPMPAVTVAKSSAAAAGPLGAFNLPASDITYTLTVTNTGGSPVDAGAIVLTDVLPAGVTFRNSALGTGGPFAISSGASGVTLTSGAASYSSDGGVTWNYAPASGYDANVRAVRMVPAGAMAPNSSFSVTFVARVK